MAMQHIAVAPRAPSPFPNTRVTLIFWFVPLGRASIERCTMIVSSQEAALRTFHINDDCTKYCITIPTDDSKRQGKGETRHSALSIFSRR